MRGEFDCLSFSSAEFVEFVVKVFDCLSFSSCVDLCRSDIDVIVSVSKLASYCNLATALNIYIDL